MKQSKGAERMLANRVPSSASQNVMRERSGGQSVGRDYSSPNQSEADVRLRLGLLD